MADRAGVTRALAGDPLAVMGRTYDPGEHAARLYPGWVIRHRFLPSGIPEVMCRRRQVILIGNHQTWPGRRCSQAHAVAHLDLGHTATPVGIFERRQEAEAADLAARRLITREQLAEVLCWTRVREEIADELLVDLETLDVRAKNMRAGERAWLRRNVRRLEETA